MLVALLMYNCSGYISPLDRRVSNHLSPYTPVSILLGGKETPVMVYEIFKSDKKGYTEGKLLISVTGINVI